MVFNNLKIAIISEDDRLWALSAWERTLPLLQKNGAEVMGLWTTPKVLAKHKGLSAPLWFLNTFGFCNTLKMTLFSLLGALSRKLKSLNQKTTVTSFQDLAHKQNLHFAHIDSPNNPQFVSWLQENEIDVLIIMVGHILKEETLGAVKMAVINKHAALLPANKGLFPYFWAVRHGSRQGISIHKVVRGIDEGDVLVQESVTQPQDLRSMIAFYFHVFRSYPQMMEQALRNLLQNQITPTNNKGSYYGLPNRKEACEFRKKKGKIIELRDIWLATKL